MVTTGILLFVVGFLVTLEAMSGEHAAAAGGSDLSGVRDSESSAFANAYLFCGILVSLLGVVLATVGPVAGIVRGKS